MTTDIHSGCRWLLSGLIAVSLMTSSVYAQDSLWRIKKSGKVSKLSGKIEAITPLSITFKSRTGSEEIPAWEVERIASAGEPREIQRARDRIESGRYADAIEDLESVDAGDNKVTQAEIAFYRALAQSKFALSGGDVTAKEAAATMNRFLKANPQSHHLVPATELMGRLAIAAGELNFASQQFTALTKSKWPEYVARGLFQSGEVMLLQEKYADAAKAYDKLISLPANDDVTQRYQLLARCQKARSAAMVGETAGPIAEIEAIIKAENPDDKELFAYAYNALGACYLKANNAAEAQEKFLFTQLLFDTEAAPHAEAVFRLAEIWKQEKQTDRANEARELLKTRYRNSWWSSRLN
jgi:tetratricopeptide (TPR) repeat protein